MRILITGASGLVGKELGKVLVARGHELVVITRDRSKGGAHLPFPCKVLEWDLVHEPLKSECELRAVEAVINLAGEPIFSGRWNDSRKRRIYESRVIGTRHLIESLAPESKPKVFISASAIGFYGSQGDLELTEASPAGDDFLAQVCQDWEGELLALVYGDGSGAPRTVALRTGMVLAPGGGALSKMLPLFQRGLGGILGDGRQWWSWIHIDDVVGLIVHALEKDRVSGALNLVSPQPVSNEDFSRTLAKVLGRSLGPRVPEPALWAALGEASSLVLSSQRVLPAAAQQSDYQFHYADLEGALTQICQQGGEEGLVLEQYLPWTPQQVIEGAAQLDGGATEVRGKEFELPVKFLGVPLKWKMTSENRQEPLAGGTLWVERVRYQLPFGLPGQLLGEAWIQGELRKMFKHRQEALIEKLEMESKKGPAPHEVR